MENEAITGAVWWRRWTLLCLLAIIAATHPWWLRAFGRYLVAEEPLVPADVAVVLSGDHRLQRAAELWHEGTVSEIWLLEHEPSYAESVGIIPPLHAVETEQLALLGVPEARLHVVKGRMREVDDAGRMISRAARESTGTTFLILCERMQCRNTWVVLARIGGRNVTERVRLLGLPSDAFDENGWWTSRTGWKDVFSATCQLLFTAVRGVGREEEPHVWDPDGYEEQIIAAYGEMGCDGSE